MKKFLYIWLIPLLWSTTSLLALQFPGDEYGMYAISSIVGLWPIFIFHPSGSPSEFQFWFLITSGGAIVMAAMGLLMSAIKVKIKLWLPLYVVFAVTICVLSLCQYPSYSRAMSKNGSIWAYIFSSANMGLYLSIILSTVIQGIIKLVNHELKSS